MEQLKFSYSKQFLKQLHVFLRHDDFIDGQPETVEKYLVRHQSENSKAVDPESKASVGQTSWHIRTELLENDNICDTVLSYWLAYLSTDITKKPVHETPIWKSILADLDGEGMDHKSFVRHLDWDYLGYGQCGVLVEGPASTAERGTDAQARGERTYATAWEPWRICRIERFKDAGPMKGKLSDLALIESHHSAPGGESYTIVRRFWIEGQSQKYKSAHYKVKGDIFADVDGKKPAQKKHYEPLGAELVGDVVDGSLDEIPFVLIGKGPKEDSVLYAVVPKNRELLNKKSWRDMVLLNQGFDRLFGFGIRPEEIKFITERNVVLVENVDASIDRIGAADPAALEVECDNVKRDGILKGTLRVAQQQQLMTRQQASGDSKREDKESFIEYLEYVSERIQSGLNEIMKFLFWFETGSKPEEGTFELTIEKDFSSIPTDQEIQEDTLVYGMCDDFPMVGRKIKAELLATKVLTRKLSANSRESEDAMKQQFVKDLRAEALQEPKNPMADIEAKILARQERLANQPVPEPAPPKDNATA